MFSMRKFYFIRLMSIDDENNNVDAAHIHLSVEKS